jgi:hypothetical protein
VYAKKANIQVQSCDISVTPIVDDEVPLHLPAPIPVAEQQLQKRDAPVASIARVTLAFPGTDWLPCLKSSQPIGVDKPFKINVSALVFYKISSINLEIFKNLITKDFCSGCS